jgi:hypothetical protein
VCSVSFIVCVVLCAVFCLSVVCYFVMCVICVLCLIVVPLPPGKNPSAVKINNNNISIYILYILKLSFLDDELGNTVFVICDDYKV